MIRAFFCISLISITSLGYCETIASQNEEPVIINIKNNLDANLPFYYFDPTLWPIDKVLTPMEQLINFTSPILMKSNGSISIKELPFDTDDQLLATAYYEIDNTNCFAYIDVKFNGKEQLTALTCGIREKRPIKPSICKAQYACQTDMGNFTVSFSKNY